MTFPITTSLDGTWQLRPADTFRQGFYPLDDASWLEQELPAHWQAALLDQGFDQGLDR